MSTPSPNPEMERAIPPAEAPPIPQKRLYANYIRAIAACAVVQMHAIGVYLYQFDPAAPTDVRFVTSDIFYGHLRWATTFFIMISGALLLRSSREEPLGPFLKKRLQRVLIPFAFWGAIYFLYLYRGDFYYGPMPAWSAMLRTVFYQDIYFHLWFIPMIAGLYILTPVLRLFIKNAARADIEYFLVLIFFTNACHHFIPGIFIIKHFSWFGYIGYYILGYYLATYPIAWKWKRIIYPAALLMPWLTAWGTWWLTVQQGTYNEKIFVYASPNVLLMTGALFLFLRDFDWDTFANRFPRIHRAAMYVAGVSYGVYFVHPLVLDVLKNGYIFGLHINPHNFFNYPLHPAIAGPLVAVLAIVLSVGIITLLGKSATLKKWVM
ncbi:MAG: acyltransferase family protein [Lewinellaceae bacterium]|nr:acyltransferase family protein [Lewinellaceae bacterium]